MFFSSSRRGKTAEKLGPSTSGFGSGFLSISSKRPQRAFTFELQQEFEDRALGNVAAPIRPLRPAPIEPKVAIDVEAGLVSVAPTGVRPPKSDRASNPPPPPRAPVDKRPKVPIIPDVTVISPTPPSSPPESGAEDSDHDSLDSDANTATGGPPIIITVGGNFTSPPRKFRAKRRKVRRVVFDSPQKVTFDEKEDYEFLQRDGRWHDKPRVYEYNKSSARALKVAKPKLFCTLLHKDRVRPKKCVLNVATMNAAVIRTYQDEIVEAGREMMDGKMSKMLPQLLHRYCNALRDMDYMQSKAVNGFDNDPFLLMTSRQMERDLMKDHGLLDEYMHPHGALPPAFDTEEPELPGIGRTARLHALQLENRSNKLASALGGGLALVVPMIIMRLEPGTVSCLVTTSGCVLVFSLVIAFNSVCFLMKSWRLLRLILQSWSYLSGLRHEHSLRPASPC